MRNVICDVMSKEEQLDGGEKEKCAVREDLNNGETRRQFLKSTGAATAGTIVSWHALQMAALAGSEGGGGNNGGSGGSGGSAGGSGG